MLTNRRREFLKIVVELYDEKKEPVHYSDVAEKMGISKWTAYDILKELEKGEYLEAEYYLEEGKSQGRSVVRFIPTEKAYQLFEKISTNEWEKLKEKLINKVKSEKNTSLEELLNGMFHASKPLEFCAYAIAAFLLKLRMISGVSLQNLENNILSCVNPSSALVLLGGTVLGALLYNKIKTDVDKVLSDNIRRFQLHLNELDQKDIYLLNNFLKDLLAAAT
jgi:Mn-dependent DtxR family transcriptional regulator